MVIIRLARGGAKKKPYYRMVVADSRNRVTGRFIERVGHFNPMARGQEVRLDINRERLDYWLSKGAQLSDRVARLLKDYDKAKAQADAAIA